MHPSFEETGVAFQVTELSRLEPLFFLIPGYVEDEAMSMQVRVYLARVIGTSGRVNKLPPCQIARGAVFLSTAATDACLRFRFDFPHGFLDTAFKDLFDSLVAANGVRQTHSFGDVPIEIVSHRSISALPGRQLLAAAWIDVVAHGTEVRFFDATFQAQHPGGLAAPVPGFLLSFAVILGVRIIGLSTGRRSVLNNTKHERVVTE